MGSFDVALFLNFLLVLFLTLGLVGIFAKRVAQFFGYLIPDELRSAKAETFHSNVEEMPSRWPFDQ